MTQEEFEFWSARSMENYARDRVKIKDWSAEEAQANSEKEYTKLLPDGVKTPHHYLYTVKNSDQNIIGFLWWSLVGPRRDKAFIFDVIIEEKFRGQGYGRKLLTLVEEDMKQKGAKSVGLHVFGFNKVARSLYESLNYEAYSIGMQKSL